MTPRLFLLATALTFLSASELASAEKRPAQTESFAKFWATFKNAVAKNDKEAVLAATHLPSFQLSKAAFIKGHSSLFSREVKKCFASAKPVADRDRGTYSVFCGEEYYFFEKVNGAYKLTDIGMND
jgi:hypothetical protein